MGKPMNHVMKRPRKLKGCSRVSDCDRISKLPDTTRAHILSFLTVKEAAQCNVLSSRWKGLWKHITRLDFDVSKELYQSEIAAAATPDEKKQIKPSRSTYRKWVNQVLALHESPTLEQVRVKFGLNASACKDIDQWIKFSISKRVKKLEIDLYFAADKYFISPELCIYLKSPANLSDVKHLTSLSLNHVNIDGELVEYFLSICPHLERLDVSFSSHLVNLRVVGPSLRLKYLKLFACKLESIELSAPKLSTFFHFGEPPVFLIGNNPLLSELVIGGYPRVPVNNALDAFSHQVTQLETLKFSIRMVVEKEKFRVAEFTKLSHLTLQVVAGPYDLMPLADLVFAAPSLKKFTLQLRSASSGLARRTKSHAEHLPKRHKCLRIFEIRGFRAGLQLLDLMDFVLVNTAGIERVIIDPYEVNERRILEEEGSDRCCPMDITRCRSVANEFKRSLPRGATLVVM